jgi:hypothetical protein
VIAVELARALRTAGLTWTPQSGDRFVVDMPDLDTQPFVVSDLTVDLHEFRGQPVLGFNGTVEWALDSVTLEQALWLPLEHQLRAGLGEAFAGLSPLPGAAFDDTEPEAAYGRALLHLLTR